MCDANTAACVKREQAAMRGSGGDGVQGGPAGSLRGRTSAVTLANLLNMHCHSMSSRSGQPRARLAACQTHLAPLPVHAPRTYQRRRGTAPGVCQQASIDHELRLQAPQHGWSRRRAFVRSVLGPTVEPCGDDRCVVARHATGQWPRPQTEGLKAQIDCSKSIKLHQN